MGTSEGGSGQRRRLSVVGIGALLAVGLVAGLAGALASAQTPSDGPVRPAQIRAGSCGQLEATAAFDLNPVSVGRSDDEDNDRDDAPAGSFVGAADAAVIASSGTQITIDLDDLLAQSHAVVVMAAEGDETVVACGEIGGFLRDGEELIIGLKAQESAGVAGVAMLDEDDDDREVDVTVYVADGVGGPAGAPST